MQFLILKPSKQCKIFKSGVMCYNSCLFFICRKSLGGDSSSRQIRCTPDWSENAIANDHLWVPTSVSGDCCYVGENDCTVSDVFCQKLFLFKILNIQVFLMNIFHYYTIKTENNLNFQNILNFHSSSGCKF